MTPIDWRELCAELANDLQEARDAVADWAAYASEYFQQKHDLRGELDRINRQIDRARAALAQPEPEVVGPSLEEVEQLCEEHCFNVEGYESIECLQGLINEAIARWGSSGQVILDSSTAPVPVPVSEGPTDDQLDLLVIAIQALAPHQPDASSHHLAAVDQGRKILRNALTRWGSGQGLLDNSAPVPADGEVK